MLLQVQSILLKNYDYLLAPDNEKLDALGGNNWEQLDIAAIGQPKVLNESFVGKICHRCGTYPFQRAIGFVDFHLANWHRINIKLSAQVFASQCCLRRTVWGGVSPMKQLLKSRLCPILQHYAKRSGPNTSRRAHAPWQGHQCVLAPFFSYDIVHHY